LQVAVSSAADRCCLTAPACRPRRRRLHVHRQWPRRVHESQVRRRAVDYADRAAQRKARRSHIARQLGIAPRTLRHWRQRQKNDGLAPRSRGRRPLDVDVDARNEVIRFLHQVSGPAVGLPALRALFPDLPHVVLEDLLRRYRRVWRRRYRQSGFQLHWHRAGAVWAMDFSQPRYPVDGVYDYLFAVRDLASGRQLAWQAVASESAEAVLPILEQLFQQHGPPLVLKSDNGSAFIAAATTAAMQEAVVAQLFSPARRPQYNGALERSNGTMKTYTHQHAVGQGHPFRWTSQDLEQSRQLANTITRPWGHRGPTPEEAWQQRTALGDQERNHFQQTLAEQRVRAADDLGLDLDLSDSLVHADRARLDRLALSRTLEQLGYLTKTHVDRPPKKPKRLARDELERRAIEHRGNQPPSPASQSSELALPESNNSHTSVLAMPARDVTMQALPADETAHGVAHLKVASSGPLAGSGPLHPT